MLTSRDIVDGASLVWSVERTKWPVKAALIAFLGVTIGSIVISMYLPLFTLIGKLASGGK